MGAYQIWYIEFEDKRARDRFEKIVPNELFFSLRRLFQYDYKLDESKQYDVTYYVGFLGYAEGQEVIKICHRNKLRLLKFLVMDLSCQTNWWDELHQKEYREKDYLKGGKFFSSQP